VTDERRIAPSPELLDRVKGEITFFMEKTFQISFGYLGALVALAAASGLDASQAVAKELGIGTAALFCTGILLLNAVYLSLASGTLFATIKRGLFLIEEDRDGSHRRWETFVRKRKDPPFRRGGFFAWNLDNFYMTPLFALIVVISIVTAIIGVREAAGALANAAVFAGVTAHILPLSMLVITGKLVRYTDAIVGAVSTSGDEPRSTP
jgi:hypothetical protein